MLVSVIRFIYSQNRLRIAPVLRIGRDGYQRFIAVLSLDGRPFFAGTVTPVAVSHLHLKSLSQMA